MKFWIKILISLAVVLVIGFSVWAFVFREKDEVQAYSKTSELVDYKESLAIEERLIELNDLNYFGGDKSKVLSTTTDEGKKIARLRAVTVGNDLVTGSGNDGVAYSYHSYRITDEMVDDILEYLLPYTKASSVNSKSLSSLKKIINTYINKLQVLNSCIDELVLFQNHMSGNTSEYQGLQGRYNSLYIKYRDALNCSSQVIMSLMEFIDLSVYSGNYILDTHSALFDAFARALNVSTSVDSILENDYANDLYIVMNRIDDLKDGDDIFSTQYTKYKFLSSYNSLYDKHKDALKYVFSSKNLEKKQMSAGASLSNISKNAQDAVVTILNVLGYVG